MGAEDPEQEGQLTDSTSASSSSRRRARECKPDALESATEDDVPAPGMAASSAAASQLLLHSVDIDTSRRSCVDSASASASKPRDAAGAAGDDARHEAEEEEAKDSQDPVFDWGSLDAVTVPPVRDPAPQAASDSRDVVEDAVEGFVSLAAAAVSAVGGAAASALGGHGRGVAGAVLALGEATARTHNGGAPHSLESLSNLTVSMPLKPARGLPAEPAKEAKKDKEEPEAAPASRPEERAPQGPQEPRAASRAASLRRRASSRGPKLAAGEAKAAARAAPAAASGSFRIALLANGSEGDVRPLVALAKILAEERRHQVRIFTNINLVHVSLKQGIDAVPVFADTQAVIQMCGGMRGSFIQAVAKPARLAEKWLKEHEGEFLPVADALEAFKPHAILAGAQVVATVLRYEKTHNIPVMPVFFSRPHLELDMFNVLVTQEPPRPSFYAVSEVVDRRPLPFSRTMRTSAWVLNDTPTVEDLSEGGALCELKEFLDNGSPPVAVGWGSMLAVGVTPAEMLELALRALMQAGRRGVILGGWAELDRVAAVAADGRLPSRLNDGGRLATFAKEEVCFVPSAPHDWLFPQCCCIVHHGGIGTLHAVLRSCRPGVVTPICADQFAHAEVVEQRHVGVGFTKALPDIKARDLAAAIAAAVGNATAIAAQTVGRKLLREEGQGAARAAEMVDGFLRGKIKLSKAGQWIKRVPAKKAPA